MERVAELRGEAVHARDQLMHLELAAAEPVEDQSVLDADRAFAAGRVEELEERLREAHQALRAVGVRAEAVVRHDERRRDRRAKQASWTRSAETLEGQAADLELAAGVGAAVPPEALESAMVELEHAKATALRARLAETLGVERAREEQAKGAERDAIAKAARLDDQVRALTDDAPGVLMASAAGIPGLALDGESVLVDGVDIDRLSGAEQLRVAVQIARRLNASTKLLILDGLERVDPELIPGFLADATAGGFQVLATRVASGPIHVEPIVGAP